MTRLQNLDAEKLSPTDASSLLGIPYELVLRYVRELERQGLLKVHRERSGRLFLSPADLDLLRKHHEERPLASTFRVEGDVDQHKHVLLDLRTLASTLEAMAKLARARIKELTQGPASSTTWITTLPSAGLTLRKPIAVSVISDGKAFSAFSADTGSTASGRNRAQAVRALRKCLAAEYVYLGQLASPSEEAAERLADLQKFIRDGEHEETP
jgi:transposase